MTSEQRAKRIISAIRQKAPLETIEKYIVSAINKAVSEARYNRDRSWEKTRSPEDKSK